MMGLHELNDKSIINFPFDGVEVRSFILRSNNHTPTPSSRVMNSVCLFLILLYYYYCY